MNRSTLVSDIGVAERMGIMIKMQRQAGLVINRHVRSRECRCEIITTARWLTIELRLSTSRDPMVVVDSV
jgi:hypothetical protein